MNSIDFVAIYPLTAGQPKQIYTGPEVGCRCGCHGRYFSQGESGYTRALNKAKRLNPRITVASNMDDSNRLLAAQRDATSPIGCAYAPDNIVQWIDIALGNGRTITIYTND